jgi:hypothetical protein
MSHINYTIILVLLILFLIYQYSSREYYSEYYQNTNSRSCSKMDVNNAIYRYQTNLLNQHII